MWGPPSLMPCSAVSEWPKCVAELAVGHTRGTLVSHCHTITQKLQEAFLIFPSVMPVRRNITQNFRISTGKLPFVTWKNTSFSRLLLILCQGEKTALWGFSLCQIFHGKSEVCLNPHQRVLHLLLTKSESFGPAEKPSITRGAMCAAPLEAHSPLVACACLSLPKPVTGLMLSMDIIQLKMLAPGTSAVVECGQGGVKVPFSLNSWGP